MEATTLSSEPLDLDTMRSGISELEEILSNCNEDCAAENILSDSDHLLKHCALRLESKVEQIVSECSDFSLLGIEELDAFVKHLKEELSVAEAESNKISNEIEVLTRKNMEDSGTLEGDTELSKFTLDLVSSQKQFSDKRKLKQSTHGNTNSKRRLGKKNPEVKVMPQEQVEAQASVLTELQKKIAAAETTLEQKEEENVALREQL